MKAWTFNDQTGKPPTALLLAAIAILLFCIGMLWHGFHAFHRAQQAVEDMQEAQLLLERLKFAIVQRHYSGMAAADNAAMPASLDSLLQTVSAFPAVWWHPAQLDLIEELADQAWADAPAGGTEVGNKIKGSNIAAPDGSPPQFVRLFMQAESAAKAELARLKASARNALRTMQISGGFLSGLIALYAAFVFLGQPGRRQGAAPPDALSDAKNRIADLLEITAELHRQLDERQQDTEALRHTQYMLTSAERIGHVGSWEHHLATGRERWSDAFFRMCGLQPGALQPSLQAFLKIVHPEDCDTVVNAMERAVEQDGEYKVHMRIVRPDGSLCHVITQAEVIRDTGGRPEYLVGSAIDITEHKQAEETLRRLAVHQVRIKEQERKRIAREIHDEMGQNLLALRIDVEMLRAQAAGRHPPLHEKLEALLGSIDGIIKSVRHIINNLRPVVLDLGLYAAIQWQVSEFQRRNGIHCALAANAAEIDLCLNDDQTTTLFRILQESLTNVARHAKARNVHISLERVGGYLFMKIADDGVGMSIAAHAKPDSFGLMGMRERISAIDGELRVDSQPGKGMTLLLAIPMQPSDKNAQGRPAVPQEAQ